MWPFSTRKPRVESAETLLNQNADYNFALYANNGDYIKLWLSEKLSNSLDIIGVHQGVSRPDVLRWIFFEHVHGRALFVGLVEYRKRLSEEELNNLPSFCRKQPPEETERAVNLQFLGKSNENIKLWLPAQLKIELTSLAEAHKQPLSNYLRSILVGHLFGHKFYQEWQSALEATHQEAVEQENEN